MRIRLFIFILIALGSLSAQAQDPQFSQFYQNRLYINPAFAGNTAQSRITANYRKQWLNLPGHYNTYAISYDHNIEDLNSGLGLSVFHDRAGTGILNFTNITGHYAYKLQLSRKTFFTAGVGVGYIIPDIDYSRFRFSDQIERDRDGNVATLENFSTESRAYPDFSAGGIFYTKHFWLGMATHHLSRPNNSLVVEDSRLDRRTTLHTGINIPTVTIERRIVQQSLTLSAHYKTQGDFDQLDFGMYYRYQVLIFGAWYRNLPFKQNVGTSPNHDAMVLMVGIQDKSRGYQIGYSYDITVSKLFPDTGGSHELGLTIELASRKRKRGVGSVFRRIPCANF